MTSASVSRASSAPDTPSRTFYVAPDIDQLTVRMGPGATYPGVGRLAPSARLTGLPAEGWLQITEGVLVGSWVSRDHLTTGRPRSTPTLPCPHITGLVTSDDMFANIRSGPGFAHPIVGRYEHRDRVTGHLIGHGPWIATDRGFVNGGTITVQGPDPRTLNGRIPAHLLSRIPLRYNADAYFEPGYTPLTPRYLNGSALAALTLLQRAFRQRFGHFATIDLTYRSYDEQAFWYDKFGSPRAAVPGTSNHGLGLAIDFAEGDETGGLYSWGSPCNDWLLTHQAGFGFDNPFAPTLQEGEDFHFNFVG